MSAKFKHRLLGTSILLMLAIIFLPDLLDGQKQVVKDDFQVIPERPEFAGVQQVTPFDDSALTQAQTVTELHTDQDEVPLDEQTASRPELPSQQFATVTVDAAGQAQTQTATTPAPTTVSQPAANPPSASTPALNQAAWVVRVGSFSNRQNANALVTKLRQEGFATFTRDITNASGQQLTSVFVGPEIRREKLEQGLPKLRQLTGVERLVISNYQPAENN
ncbi:SPOR domain-containing protein [Alishewanella jeotgali]|uniref:DedD protein n=1 Tax=Alishewanella jeotgali KCTC 22429 TaxID=1129374 RepID=H3ZHK2_9ALTE|nr:SPOR domain-containing protein [Alishewanella jeotgali]EHR39858.1 dedD protein [Alishewanella jeotgali KCTC 22429]